jgi:peptidoglycan pentaglycine glycine transferase (the first glycine)
LEAQIINDANLWDTFVAESACCNITQSYEWGALAPHLGASEALRVGVVDEAGQLCAAMLVLVDRLPVLHLPYFYAPRGPIISDPDSPAMTVLLNFVRAQARKRGACMLKVEPSVPDGDIRWPQALQRRGFVPNPHATHVRHEWVLDVRPEEKELLAGMKEKWRYNIRLATRKGLTLRLAESQADIDAFYRLYQITSERDRFAIHKQAHYEDVLRLFGPERAALFLVEYEGQPIAGNIVVALGRWCWYMFGASGNEQRERMPNHLLQWNAIRWAREHGCWHYNFRGIPEVLEEGQEMWGVYLFKRGFGGYPLRFLQTHDLPYRPLAYQAYRRLLDAKRWRDDYRRRRALVMART